MRGSRVQFPPSAPFTAMPLTTTEKQIITKVKRREITLRKLGIFLGVVSFIALCSVVIIAFRKIQRTQPKLEDDYIAKHYGADGRGIPNPPAKHSEISGNPLTPPAQRRTYDNSGTIDFTRPNKEAPKTVSNPNEVLELKSGADRVLSEFQKGGGIQNIESKQAAIAAVTKEFFDSKSIAEALPLVRDARRVRPLMEDYYSRNSFVKHQWKSIGWAMPVEEPGYRFAYVQALFEDSPPVHLVVEESDSGFLVDWESSVHYSELSWSDFQTQKPREPKLFRLLASKPDDAEKMGNDEKQTFLKLKHPLEEGVIYAHFTTNDPQFRPLLEQLDLCKWKDAPLILRLCYPGLSAAESNNVEIASAEGKGWLFLKSQPRG